MANEADTCRKFVVPKLQSAGWDNEPHSIAEQRTFTDGRIIPLKDGRAKRRAPKRADYLLRYVRDFTLAVVEAKADYNSASDGLQQAKEYASILALKFAYSTNGTEIIEFDFLTGRETHLSEFPTPAQLWSRLQDSQGIDALVADRMLTPFHHASGKSPRYYQEIAINRAVQSILQGKSRVLLTMATGTGKTVVAFQICWKLWSSRWNRSGAPHRRPRILYLADRNFLVDDPKIARDERRPGLYREYPPDFFDLILVDECHRGSAKDESNWRAILEWFSPAFQLGMTATPLREDNRDTYLYFGNPIYQYSLRQGIEDGFLAPYRVHRVVTEWDAAGWRPSKGELDRYGREIPDEEYETKDFERAAALRARSEAIARHLTTFLRQTDRFGKTIVFCVDQEHADDMRRAISNLNADLVKTHSDYVCRVTADEGEIGRGHMARFQDVETKAPAILTTSQLLTTGLDAPTCKNVVLARVVGSMTEFKQIIGRGTRVRDHYGKLWFSILDYTGSATRMFADPDFDGDPVLVTETEIDSTGEPTQESVIDEPVVDPGILEDSEPGSIAEPKDAQRRKFYFDNGQVEIAAHLVYELDPDGKQLRVVRFTDYAGEKVRTLFPSAPELQTEWADPLKRAEIIERLSERGIDFDELAAAANQPDADPFDLLCHLAYNAPLRTRRERVERLRSERKDFFDRYGPEARVILNELLEKYAEHGTAQFLLPDVLRVPPISNHGQPGEIISIFGGTDQLRQAVTEMQTLLYAA